MYIAQITKELFLAILQYFMTSIDISALCMRASKSKQKPKCLHLHSVQPNTFIFLAKVTQILAHNNFKKCPRFGIVLVVLICVEEYLLRKVMLAAHDRGMTNGEYVFIYPNLLPSENWERLYMDDTVSDETNNKVRSAFRPLVQVIVMAGSLWLLYHPAGRVFTSAWSVNSFAMVD